MNPEILGLTASCIIFASGLAQSELRLRIINAVGAILMSVYGVLIKAPSVSLLNGGLAVAHLCRVWKLKKSP